MRLKLRDELLNDFEFTVQVDRSPRRRLVVHVEPRVFFFQSSISLDRTTEPGRTRQSDLNFQRPFENNLYFHVQRLLCACAMNSKRMYGIVNYLLLFSRILHIHIRSESLHTYSDSKTFSSFKMNTFFSFSCVF